MNTPSNDATVYATSSLEGSATSFRPGGLEVTQLAIFLCSLWPGAKVLDLGCGAGQTLEYLIRVCGFEAFGVDISMSACEQAVSQPCKPPIARSTGGELPFADNTMDAVLAECCLSLVRDQQKVLRECARVLVPEGRLVVTDMYARNPQQIHHLRCLANSCVSRMFVRSELQQHLEAVGLQIWHWEDQSKALNQLVAQFMLEHESVASLWSSEPGATEESRGTRDALLQVRPGYFLLVARKPKGGRSS